MQVEFEQLGERLQVCPFNAVCLPLNYSGNPGINGVSYRDANLHTLQSTAAGLSAVKASLQEQLQGTTHPSL